MFAVNRSSLRIGCEPQCRPDRLRTAMSAAPAQIITVQKPRYPQLEASLTLAEV